MIKPRKVTIAVVPVYQKALESMQSGVITAAGFLGSDKRPLADIIETDEGVMNFREAQCGS